MAEVIYTTKCNVNGSEVTIMVYYHSEEGLYEIYYRYPQYAFEFAFGIPEERGFSEALELAIANVEDYNPEV